MAGDELTWTKSSWSVAANACVELAADGDGIALRDSKNPDKVLHFTKAELRAWLDGAKHGEFDHLVE